MKHLFKPASLPVMTAGAGGIALVLRKLLYRFATDGKGLLVPGHLLSWLLGLLTVAVMAVILVSAWKLDGSNRYRDNFRPEPSAFAGHIAAALGIGITVLSHEPILESYLGTAWHLLGILSPVCLVLAGLARMQGKRPFFLLHLIPCLFLVFHIVNHYQVWSGNPQLQDYVFTLFGTMALMFFGFYCAAFDVGSGQRRMHLTMGLSAVYLLLAELARTDYPWLYVGGILWAVTGLCSLIPVPKTKPEPKTKKEK